MSVNEQVGSIPPLTLGWRLRMSLEVAGVSVQEMADYLQVDRRTPGRWMHDHGSPPRRPSLIAWALKTGVPYEWLATGSETVTDPDPTPRARTKQQKPSSARTRSTTPLRALASAA